MSFTYPPVPEWVPDPAQWIKAAIEPLKGLLIGKTNNVTTVTLTANVTSTTLTDPRIRWSSYIGLTPTTANASAEIGNGTIYVSESSRVNGSVVITHANNVQTDRTFKVTIIG